MSAESVEFKKIRTELSRRGLTSVMDNTKWEKLLKAIRELPFPPAYQMKLVLCEEPHPTKFHETPTYLGDCGDESLRPFFHIEWIRIHPRILRNRGKLIEPLIEDITDKFISILEDTGVPYCIRDKAIFIYGHIEKSEKLFRKSDDE